MARPTKYNDEVVDRIISAIEMGATYNMAASYGGITYETFRQWMHTKPVFSGRVKEAEGNAVIRWLAKIEAAASSGAWQAAAWKLERRYPASYGRTGSEQQVIDEQVERMAAVVTELIRRYVPPDDRAIAAAFVEQRMTLITN